MGGRGQPNMLHMMVRHRNAEKASFLTNCFLIHPTSASADSTIPCLNQTAPGASAGGYYSLRQLDSLARCLQITLVIDSGPCTASYQAYSCLNSSWCIHFSYEMSCLHAAFQRHKIWHTHRRSWPCMGIKLTWSRDSDKIQLLALHRQTAAIAN